MLTVYLLTEDTIEFIIWNLFPRPTWMAGLALKCFGVLAGTLTSTLKHIFGAHRVMYLCQGQSFPVQHHEALFFILNLAQTNTHTHIQYTLLALFLIYTQMIFYYFV